MFVHEFEVYRFSELPEDEQQNIIDGVMQLYNDESLVETVKKENLYIRVPARDGSMHYPLPLQACATDFAMELSMKAGKNE